MLAPVSLTLSAGEQIIYEGHPSWRAILAFYLKWLLAAVIIAIIAQFIVSTAATILIVAIILGLAVIVGFIKRVTTTYTITNRRLNIKRGIISRDIQETRLERVQNVNYQQGVFQRMLQVGDVDFDTAATDDYDFVFAGVANPDKVVTEVDLATHAASAGTDTLGTPAVPPQ